MENFIWSNRSKDGLVSAFSEVDYLVNLVNLITLIAELLEDLGPWELPLLFLHAK
jgi:hypothetical protein